MSSRVGFGFSASSACATRIMAGVQYPHCMPCVSQKASCNGDNSPGPGVTPSIVVIGVPSACGANIRHARTATPSNRTVQAPQTPCSQPTCAPLRPRCSRRQSSNVVRGSTSSVCSAPLTMRLIRIVFLSDGVGACISNRLSGEADGNPATVFGRGMQIGQGRDIGQGFNDRTLNSDGVQCPAFQLLLSTCQPNGKVCRGANANDDTVASAVIAEFHLRRGGYKGKVASSCIHLTEADANSSGPFGKLHRGQYRPTGQAGGHWSDIEVTCRYRDAAASETISQGCVQSQGDQRQLRGRISVGK